MIAVPDEGHQSEVQDGGVHSDSETGADLQDVRAKRGENRYAFDHQLTMLELCSRANDGNGFECKQSQIHAELGHSCTGSHSRDVIGDFERNWSLLLIKRSH